MSVSFEGGMMSTRRFRNGVLLFFVMLCRSRVYYKMEVFCLFIRSRYAQLTS